jgi:hypothetical protein
VKALAVSGVIVWAASLVFVHTTFVPFATVTLAGLKEYTSLFSTIFISTSCADVDDVVAAVLGVDTGLAAVVGAAAVGLAGVLADPPQAARLRIAIMASKEINQTDRG